MKIIGLIIALTIAFTSQAWGAEQPKLSGFIEEPPVLEPTAGMEGVWHWNKPGLPFKDYDKVLLADIEIFLAPDSKYKGIDGKQIKILADSMRGVMTEALDPDYPVVSLPGSGVMVARIAITNVHLKKPKHRLGQYTPIGLLATGIKALAGKSKNISLEGASVEAEIVESRRGGRLGVRLGIKPLRRLSGEHKGMSWEAIEESLKVYGKRFRERAEKVLGE